MSSNAERSSCLLDVPSERYRDSFLNGVAEFTAEGRIDSTYTTFLGYNLSRLEHHFSTFVWDLRQLGEKSLGRTTGCQDCVYWLVDHNEYVGQLSVRPELATPYLMTYGGHIGYSIRPSMRRRGYGNIILDLALSTCRTMGMSRLLITCDSDNIASKKIIERNGGDFESAMKMDGKVLKSEGRKRSDDVQKLRYWIDLGLAPKRVSL